eukprot:12065319-Alexandrium_andersonii.AAC.1
MANPMDLEDLEAASLVSPMPPAVKAIRKVINAQKPKAKAKAKAKGEGRAAKGGAKGLAQGGADCEAESETPAKRKLGSMVETASVDGCCPGLDAKRDTKNRKSKAYHSELSACKRAGLPEHEAKAKARAASALVK